MKHKNKKLMIVVASLLLLVGVSFAYFVSSVLLEGKGSKTEFTTATIKGSELRVEGTISFDDLDIYPGHENVSSIKVTAVGENELIPYNVIWEGENTLNTTLNYKVYKTSSKIEVNTSCEKKKKVIDGALRYYEECSISNIEQLGEEITSGTINTNETKKIIVTDEFITSTASGTSMYYYVILEYPNLEEEQNEDINGRFNGKVRIEVSDTEPDIDIIAAYIKQEDGSYKEVADIPQSGYILNSEKSVCSNGATITGTVPNITINNLSKSGTSCYLYFDEYVSAKDTILANSKVNSGTPDFSQIATTDEGIYKTEDDWGISYYYRGAVINNYIKFAGFYWRIIRINGDGSLRIIYDGTSAHGNGESSDDRQIDQRPFNSLDDNNMYVGYMYTEGEVHGLKTSSTIKDVLDNWYIVNVLNKGYSEYVSMEAGFCGDREPSTDESISNGSGGTGTIQTYYGAYIRLVNRTKSPTLKCKNNDDMYTVSESNRGNNALSNPIGLITADEVAMAGLLQGKGTLNSYLYIGQQYWTMSPFRYITLNVGSDVFSVSPTSGLNGSPSEYMFGVRPVINLASDVELTGSGTSEDPYVVKGA